MWRLKMWLVDLTVRVRYEYERSDGFYVTVYQVGPLWMVESSPFGSDPRLFWRGTKAYERAQEIVDGSR